MNKEEKLKLRELYSSANADQRHILEELYPELAESEDERIRKWIIDDIRYNMNNEPLNSSEYKKQGEKAIAWLEKQGEQNLPSVNEHAWLYLVADVLTWKDGIGQYLDDPRVQELAKKLCNEYAQKLYNPSVISNSSNIGNNKQEPDDKVEPKFKVGDWVINKQGIIDQIAMVVDNVTNHTYGYDTITGKYFNDYTEGVRLWTIKDTKPGDILATKEGKPFIFKDFSDTRHPNNPTAYCGIDKLNNFIRGSDNCWWTDEKLYPATKEQRDLLFQKMKEAGYKWENNKLEKVNNKDFVDLGLPSGTLWAKCNLGAEKETDFGLFYQWGDTKGYKGVDEHQFNWNDYKFGSWDKLTKYNENDNKLILDNEDDPVFVATEGVFKLPTKEQLQELIDSAYYEWTSIDGVNGIKFTNKKDDTKYIFIPAAGHGCYGSHGVGSWGCVWSSSRYDSNANYAWNMDFGGYYVDMCDFHRCDGFSVRGVLNK